MDNSLFKQISKYVNEHKYNKRVLTVFLCLAVIVTVATVAALSFTGIAMNREVKVMDCPLVIHQHTDECKDDDGNYICDYADYVVHIHGKVCYDQNGKLVCTLPEIPEHTHTEECYETVRVLTCGIPEDPGHQHDDSCYTVQRGELLCGKTEHIHSESCYSQTNTLVCENTDEDHQHDDSCYQTENTLVCGLEEHTHDDDCFETTRVLTCQLPESKGTHIHGDECYETQKQLTCGKLELHTHDDSCRDEDGNLICGQTELVKHIHEDSCFKVKEADGENPDVQETSELAAETTCGIPEHVHDETCLNENDELVCGLEEHTHTEDCMVGTDGQDTEAEADQNTAEALFEKTFEDESVIVTASYSEAAEIPDEAELKVTAMAGENDPDYYASIAADSAPDSGLPAEHGSLRVVTYSIGFYMPDGTEVEPLAEVTIRIQFKPESGIDAGAAAVVVHTTDQGDAEVLAPSTENDSVSFATSSFSAFTILFDAGDNKGDLTPFVSNVTITDSDGKPVEDGTLYLGEDYSLTLEFKEEGAQHNQFEWDEDGKLTYQIPKVFCAEPVTGRSLTAVLGGQDVVIGYYSVTEDGKLILELTDEGKEAINSSTNFTLKFDTQVQVDKNATDQDVHFGDAGESFGFKVTDQPQIGIKKNGHYEENADGKGGTIAYSVKTTVEHGNLNHTELKDVLTPPQTQSLDLTMRESNGKPDVTVTVKKANGEEYALTPDDYDLEELPPDPENPQKKGFGVKLKGQSERLEQDDELTVTYNYDVQYKDGTVDVFWGNVLNEVTVGGTMPVKDPANPDKVFDTKVEESQSSNVEITVTPPGDGVILKTQEFSEKDHTLHYTLYTLVPAGNWTPFHIHDDATVELGGEKYNLTEFKENGRVKNLTVSAVDVNDGRFGNWSDSTGEQRRQSLEELKKSAHVLKGFDIYDMWSYSPKDYDPKSVENYICLWLNNNLEIVFGEWEYGKTSAWGNWEYENDRLIITEYDLDMSNDLGKLSLVNTSDYVSNLEKEASDVLLAGIRNTVNMRFDGYNPGYSVFFNNSERMNKTGALDKSDNTITWTVTMNTADTTVNKYFREVNTDLYAQAIAHGWGPGDYYPYTMQAVFYDELPDGWEYVEGSLTATAYNPWETYYPYSNSAHKGYLDSPIVELEDGKKVISAPLVFFYNDNGTVENNGCKELFNTFSDSLMQLTFTYKLKATDEWLKDHALDVDGVKVHNYAEVKDKDSKHWDADADVYYYPARLTKAAEQDGTSNLLRFSLKINDPEGANLDPNRDCLVVTDTSKGIQIQTNSIVVKDKDGNELTFKGQADENYELGKNQWVMLPADEGQFKLMVPDEMALTITYDTLIPEIGTDVPISNEASIDSVQRSSSSFEQTLHADKFYAGGDGDVYELNIEKTSSADSNIKLPKAKFKFYIVRASDTDLQQTGLITVGGKKYSCYSENNWTFETNEYGQFKIEKNMNWKLEPRNYYILEEIEAPAGYYKLEDPILFYYGTEGEMDTVQYPDAVFALPNGTLTIDNVPIPYKLPETGGHGILLYSLSGAALVLVGLLIAGKAKKKSRRA